MTISRFKPSMPGFSGSKRADPDNDLPPNRRVSAQHVAKHTHLSSAPMPQASLASQRAPRAALPALSRPASPKPASAPVATPVSAAEQKNMNRLGASIYKEHRYYHGTNQEHAAIKQRDGMDPALKTGSLVDNAIKKNGAFADATPEELGKIRTLGDKHFYVTKALDGDDEVIGAKDYAELASSDTSGPKVLRSILPPSLIKLEVDPDSPAKAEAFRTSEKVPAGLFLGSKSEAPVPSAASEAFKDLFNNSPGRKPLRINTTLDSQQAAAMLKDQQTPSPTDFSKPMWPPR